MDIRRVKNGRGQTTAYPHQLESLIRLADADAKMQFSASVELPDVNGVWRLHREALRQAATDRPCRHLHPDCGHLGGHSERRREVAAALEKIRTTDRDLHLTLLGDLRTV